MKTFEVAACRTMWYSAYVEAETVDEAKEKARTMEITHSDWNIDSWDFEVYDAIKTEEE